MVYFSKHNISLAYKHDVLGVQAPRTRNFFQDEWGRFWKFSIEIMKDSAQVKIKVRFKTKKCNFPYSSPEKNHTPGLRGKPISR